ncbi:MAG TPA: aldehyde dehydrogenase (NADP(+)) [Candidatus Limnocylindrales bacterium]|nr:aldehyde dehydrogenase (NADP(+)) [Candidatus Limnocylindrales bacterium]
MKLEGLSILGYDRAKPSGAPTCAINPANGAKLEPGYFWAGGKDVERAAELAQEAFTKYRHWPSQKRAGLLRRIAELFEANAPAIIERANLETALPPARLQGESARTCGQLRLFASLIEAGWWLDARIDHGDPNRKPLPKPDVRSLLMPLGPVAVFSSSNFPFAFSVAGGDTASALAAGCPVVVKPHQGHLGTSELVGLIILQAAQESGAPEGLFSMLYGPGRDVGVALVKHPLIKAVGFTGSRAGGRALMDAAAARPEPIPVYAEMGSINPVFLLPGALENSAESLASGLHGSVTLGVGQFCTNPGLVFVEKSPAADAFLAKLESLMLATPAGTMLTPSICSEYYEGVRRFSKTTGVRLLTPSGGNLKAGQASTALFTTDGATFLADESLMAEIFGPSTLVVQCGSRAEMLAAAEKLEGQLTATVHGTTEEFRTSRDVLAILETKAGRLVCNGFPTGVEVCHAMNHGGPYPATADGRSTSVGTRAIERFTRPVCYQSFPDAALPDALKESNPLGLWRLVDGKLGTL